MIGHVLGTNCKEGYYYLIRPLFTYKIIDLMGKTLQNAKYTEGSPLDVSALPQGFYFLILLNGTRQATVKFVKQ